MKRLSVPKRPNWKEELEELGFEFHTHLDGSPYWAEGVCYGLDSLDIDYIEKASSELAILCEQAVAQVIERDFFSKLGIPAEVVPLIMRSWENKDPSITFCFDFRFDYHKQLKLCGIRVDSVGMLAESSDLQWRWLKAIYPQGEQYNDIFEALVDFWKTSHIGHRPVHFTASRESKEDLFCSEYYRSAALEAGVRAKLVELEDIVWKEDERLFLDSDYGQIYTLHAIYRWEWMLQDEFGVNFLDKPCLMLEPPWTLIADSPGFLPILKELNPDCPYLLDYSYSQGNYVYYPPISVSGPNAPQAETQLSGLGAKFDYNLPIYVADNAFQSFDQRFPLLACWVVKNECVGVGILESDQEHDFSTPRFVPHLLL